jgi:hypothetical protein
MILNLKNNKKKLKIGKNNKKKIKKKIDAFCYNIKKKHHPSVFDTLSSVALTSATEMARATLTYLQLYGWKQIGVVRPTTNFERLSLHSLKSYLKETRIAINIEVELDPFLTPDEIIASGKLRDLRRRARSELTNSRMDKHNLLQK